MHKREQGTKSIGYYDNLAGEILNSKDPRRIEVAASGISMFPTVLPGDRIIIDSLKIDNLAVGDIILFSRGNLFVCHRIKEVIAGDEEKFFITQGDSRSSLDQGRVSPEDVCGKVISIIRGRSHIDPYTYALPFLKRVFLKVKLRLFCAASKFKSRLGAVVVGFQLSSSYRKTIGRLIFRLISSKIKYSFLFPRRPANLPVYKYIEIPFTDIRDKESKFFAELKQAGNFKLAVNIGERRIAVIEVTRFNGETNLREFWALTNLNVRFLYRGSPVDEGIINGCCSIISSIGANRLYAVIEEKADIVKAYLKQWDAEFIRKNNKRSVYLLPQVSNDRGAKLE